MSMVATTPCVSRLSSRLLVIGGVTHTSGHYQQPVVPSSVLRVLLQHCKNNACQLYKTLSKSERSILLCVATFKGQFVWWYQRHHSPVLWLPNSIYGPVLDHVAQGIGFFSFPSLFLFLPFMRRNAIGTMERLQEPENRKVVWCVWNCFLWTPESVPIRSHQHDGLIMN